MCEMDKIQGSGNGAGPRVTPDKNVDSAMKMPNDKGIQHACGHELSSGCISINVQCPCLLVNTYAISEGDPEVVEDHKVLDRVASRITTWDEVTTLGIWLHCDPNDVERLQSENNSIKGAAYKILRSFYSRSKSSESKEKILKDAIKELGKEAVMSDFKLNF